MIRVPGLTLLQLEERAKKLLSDYAQTIGADVPTPIPVVEIAEDHLALELECVDLHALLGVPRRVHSADILGRMLFEEHKIQIDHSLDPKEHPPKLGRYRYSVGHELGHWVLHRSVVLKRQASTGKPVVVCRDMETTSAPPVIEFQAESFSSFLLLPRERVLDAWGGQPAFAFSAWSHGSRDLRRLWSKLHVDEDVAIRMFRTECDRLFDDEFAAPLAKLFQVSKQAMRMRLQALGLLTRVRPWSSRFAA